ncbi:putative chlorophyll(ide) b reductase NYC1 [Morus notabilis]|uniref:chlorophyll(ide) b reductase n=2 Tax=Morus notabilis TaxID=981085 RepID=W9RIM1_9ROSA|nr:probable chlorophyll(ide) b reductase NYC1, chloroplastic [Morus notabilis]EXB79941.1 putative chlorophyll(ide) b reductase NYC1 [Morus notabilis]
MAAVTRLHICPHGLDRFSFKDQLRPGPRILIGPGFRYGVRLKGCRAYRSEEDQLGEKEMESARKSGKVKEKETLKLRKGSGFWSCLKYAVTRGFGFGPRNDDEYSKAVAKLEEVFSSIAIQIGRYIVTMMSTGVILGVGFQLSGGDNQLNTLIWYSWLGGIIIGTMIGANMVLEEHCRAGPRNVVVTGSTRGLGKALAREFLLSGDRVVVASRSPESVQTTVRELEENLKEGIIAAGSSSKTNLGRAKVIGIACDVCNPDDVQRLANFAVGELGSIDIWINNAGTNKGFRPLLQFTDEDITQIVSTNLVGSLLCTREATRVMRNQAKGGHIFNMDGAGSGGSSTPLTAVYGSTKCGLRQLQASLLKESKRSKVGVHTASPGMVLTDLLLSGSTIQNKRMFNIICELPETVARSLVPRMRVVRGSGKAINYLTPPRILIALVTAWLRRGRWFDEQGRALYAAEADRIRNWAENRTRFSFTDAMEMYTENTWLSVFSLSVVCAFIILSSTSSNYPGT